MASTRKSSFQTHRRSRSDATASSVGTRRSPQDETRRHSVEDLHKITEKIPSRKRPEYYSSTFQPRYNTYTGTGPYIGTKTYELTKVNQPYGYFRKSKRSKTHEIDNAHDNKVNDERERKGAVVPLPAISNKERKAAIVNKENGKGNITNNGDNIQRQGTRHIVGVANIDNGKDKETNNEQKNDTTAEQNARGNDGEGDRQRTVNDKTVTAAPAGFVKSHKRSSSDSTKAINRNAHLHEQNKTNSLTDLSAVSNRLPPLPTFLVYDSNYHCSYHVYKGTLNRIPTFRQYEYRGYTYEPTKTKYGVYPTGKKTNKTKDKESNPNINNRKDSKSGEKVDDVNTIILTDQSGNDRGISERKDSLESESKGYLGSEQDTSKDVKRDDDSSDNSHVNRAAVAAVAIGKEEDKRNNKNSSKRDSKVTNVNKAKDPGVYQAREYSSNYKCSLHTYGAIRHYKLNQYPYGPEKPKQRTSKQYIQNEANTEKEKTKKKKVPTATLR